MKRIIPLLISLLLLLAACQPTPEVDAVKQKDTNVLIDTVRAEEQQRQETGTEMPPIKTQFPERFMCDFYTGASNVHVISDAPIRIKTDGIAFPLARVERRCLSNTERVEIYKRLLETDTLYIYQQQPRTREDIARSLQMYMNALDVSPENKASWMHATDSTEEEWNLHIENLKSIIAELQALYNDTPEEIRAVPNPPWDGALPEGNPSEDSFHSYSVVGSADAHQEMWMYDLAQVEEQSTDNNITFWRGAQTFEEFAARGFNDDFRIDPSAYDVPKDGASLSPREAADLVKSMLGDAAKDYDVSDIYWGNNEMRDGEAVGSQGDKWGYSVYLTPKLSGASMLFVSAEATSDNDDSSVVRFWPYDKIWATVSAEGELDALGWSGALQITEILSENTTLLPFDTVMERFTKQMNYQWQGWDDFRDGVVTVNDVQLGLFRIREQNDMDHGLLVPVWFFTGTFTFSEEQQKKDHITELKLDSMNPLLIINAIDGTIINSNTGY